MDSRRTIRPNLLFPTISLPAPIGYPTPLLPLHYLLPSSAPDADADFVRPEFAYRHIYRQKTTPWNTLTSRRPILSAVVSTQRGGNRSSNLTDSATCWVAWPLRELAQADNPTFMRALWPLRQDPASDSGSTSWQRLFLRSRDRWSRYPPRRSARAPTHGHP